MKERIDAGLYNNLKEFGINVGNWNECFHCGNCTAICPLTEKYSLFPRKEIRLLQIGLKNDIISSAEPWLCYYCGDCSKTCPRDANPGELMMTLRRYLTSVYDWTGLAKRIYTSKIWEYGMILFLALVVLVLYTRFTFFPSGNSTTWITSSNGGVAINKIAPWHRIHLGDWLMAATLAFFLITNIFNMFLKIIVNDKSVKVPFKLYFTEFWSVIFHFATQWRFSKCESKPYWYLHWFLMTGYILLFTMIVFFLSWFQTDNIYAWWYPQRLFGYYATAGLFTGVIYFAYGRFKKANEHAKHSHITDWTFLVMLFLTTLTGILLHILRLTGHPVSTYYMYLIHLMILVPMLTIEVPFSKWSHLAYRPFGIYFANVKKAAIKLQQQS